MERTYLGFDLSTQQLKVVAINDSLEVVTEEHVHFDTDLPEFATSGGVNAGKDGVVTASPLMWAKALDLLLDKLKKTGFDFSRVSGLSGCAQQLGSVYWATGAQRKLGTMDPSHMLYTQVEDLFSLPYSPVWLDCSTSVECRLLEEAVGREELVASTGYFMSEGMTSAQIFKIWRTKQEEYQKTERISLISSFLASLITGTIAPIDLGDGSVTGLLDIRTKVWADAVLDTIGEGVKEKLGKAVDSDTVVGVVSEYMQARYGFSSSCTVTAFTGDNPSSFAGLAMRQRDVSFSLGTSDALTTGIEELFVQKPGQENMILIHPVNRDIYMPIVYNKNGSLTRERVRDQRCGGSWSVFSDLLDKSPPGNDGNIGLYFDLPETVPSLCGDFRFNARDEMVEEYDDDMTEVRALVEGQVLAKKVRFEAMGIKLDQTSRLIVTGGASVNKSILQVIADVMGIPVFSQPTHNSAPLGSAYRARYSCIKDITGCTYAEMVEGVSKSARLVCMPVEGLQEVYADMCKRLVKLQLKAAQIMKSNNDEVKVDNSAKEVHDNTEEVTTKVESLAQPQRER